MEQLKPGAVDYIVVHASATPADMDIGVKEIDRWHRKRGWLRIGYHYVIRRDGHLEEGRPSYMVGAHVQGHNHHSFGVCLVGGLDSEGNPENNFTPEQFQTLGFVVDLLRDYFGQAKVLGHRDFDDVAKACPCFDVSAYLNEENPDA